MSEADWGDLSVARISDDGDELPDDGTLVPGSKTTCPECSKILTVTKTGQIRGHKCVNDVPSGKRDSILGGRKKTPPKVRKLAVAVIASGVESGTAHTMARYIPCEAARVPVDLPDPDIMVGPIVDLLWPSLPKGAQKLLSRVADESDLIVCAMAWWEWAGNLRSWVKTERARQAAETSDLREGGSENVVTFSPSIARAGDSRAEPFVPA